MTRGLFIGRFQPFHNGHLYVIHEILEREDELIIGIGSTQDSFSLANPLTAGERYEIIRAVLINEGIWDKSHIVEIPDINENYIWPSRVLEYTPSFDRIYTGNNLVETLFKTHNIEVIRVKFYNRDSLQGRVIREKILKGEPWENYVPEIVLNYLKKFKFAERLRYLYGKQ